MCKKKKKPTSKTESNFQEQWYLQTLLDVLHIDKFIEPGQINIARYISSWGILKQNAY